MTVALWTVQAVLAVTFLGAGGSKLVQPRKRLIDSGMPVFEHFSDPSVKAIGTLEVAGAIGVILPAVTGVAAVLVPLAATGLALVMAGAVITHVRYRAPRIAIPAVLLVLAAFVAWGRFGPYGF